jgi:hypothetical protein
MDQPFISSQYLQFDRGRYTLNMTQSVIRSWASCDKLSCTGSLGALFITSFPDTARTKVQAALQPLVFKFEISNLIMDLRGGQDTSLARMELHRFYDTWAVRIVGLELRGECFYLKWDEAQWIQANHSEDDEYKRIDHAPPEQWDSLLVADCANATILQTQQPLSAVIHDAHFSKMHTGISIQMTYGFNFSSTPSPGDSEQIVFIVAQSPQPIRLKRLAVVSLDNGVTTTYTTAKGFVIDPSRVIDLTTACNKPRRTLRLWLTQAILILGDDPPPLLTNFIESSCAQITENVKAYWLSPVRALTPRTVSYQMEVVAEFA